MAPQKRKKPGRPKAEDAFEDVRLHQIEEIAGLFDRLASSMHTVVARAREDGKDPLRVETGPTFRDSLERVITGVAKFENATKTPLEKAHGLSFLLPETGETQIAAESTPDYDTAASLKAQADKTRKATPRKKSDTGG